MSYIKIAKSPRKKENILIEHKITNDPLNVFSTFIKTLQNSKISHSLDIFYYNHARTRFMEVTPAKMSDSGRLAEYSHRFHIIRYIKESIQYAIMHENLHLASTIETKNYIYSGFSQVNKQEKTIIGIGLNEGYTNLLDRRYFSSICPGKEDRLKRTYPLLTNLADLLEGFLSSEFMEQAYFEADLHAITEVLSHYVDELEINTFLKAMDSIYYFGDNARRINVLKVFINYKYVIYFLCRCYMKHFAMLLSNGEINQENYEKAMALLKSIMQHSIRFFIIKIPGNLFVSDKEFVSIRKQYEEEFKIGDENNVKKSRKFTNSNV